MSNLQRSKTSNSNSKRGKRGKSLLGATVGLWAIVGTSMVVVVQPALADGPILAQPAAGQPLHGLSPAQLDRFFVGQARFTQILSVEDGLGPIWNQDSCASCHNNPIGGTGNVPVLRGGHLMGGVFDPLTDFGGSLFQLESNEEECREIPPP